MTNDDYPYFSIPYGVKRPVLIFNGERNCVANSSDAHHMKKMGVKKVRADFGPPVGIRLADLRVFETNAPTPNDAIGTSRLGPKSQHPRSARVFKTRKGRTFGGRGKLFTGGPHRYDPTPPSLLLDSKTTRWDGSYERGNPTEKETNKFDLNNGRSLGAFPRDMRSRHYHYRKTTCEASFYKMLISLPGGRAGTGRRT